MQYNFLIVRFLGIPGNTWEDKLFKRLKMKGIQEKKVFGFLGGAIYREPGSHLQERTLRVIQIQIHKSYL
jgi:hypothetical protein